jgi:hypothetical protein
MYTPSQPHCCVTSPARQRGEVLTALVAVVFAVTLHLTVKWHKEDAAARPPAHEMVTQEHAEGEEARL